MDYRQGPLGPMGLDNLGPETDVPYGLLLQLQEEYQPDDEEAALGLFGPAAEPSKVAVKKPAKRRKDPNAPKKAKSAYSFFMQERRSGVDCVYVFVVFLERRRGGEKPL